MCGSQVPVISGENWETEGIASSVDILSSLCQVLHLALESTLLLSSFKAIFQFLQVAGKRVEEMNYQPPPKPTTNFLPFLDFQVSKSLCFLGLL
jgi:hypothetical protein